MSALESLLTPDQLSIFTSFRTPYDIQDYLDHTPYSAEDANRCPLRVMQDHVAHCLDGAFLAAAAFRRLGLQPVVINLFPDPGLDDDHLLAIFKVNGCYGAVAKSNTVGLRYREPVYRSLRELVMSYFEPYFSIKYVRTLRYYTRPLDLSSFDRFDWETCDAGVDIIEKRLLSLSRRPLLTAAQSAALHPIDQLSYDAYFMNANWDGLYKPKV